VLPTPPEEATTMDQGTDRRSSHAFRLVLAVMLVAGVALGACGGDSGGGSGSGDGNVTDLSELEAKLVNLQEEKSPNLSVEGADCPEEVDLSEGTTFECIVTIEGVEAPYDVTLTEDDPEADVGSFHVEPARTIIDVSIVTDFIAQQVGGEAECGSEAVLITDVGDTIDCTVTSEGQTQDVQMIVKDEEGTVGFNN
jgi:hypothetical protein